MCPSDTPATQMEADQQANEFVIPEPPPTWAFLVWRDEYRKKARHLERDHQIALALQAEIDQEAQEQRERPRSRAHLSSRSTHQKLDSIDSSIISDLISEGKKPRHQMLDQKSIEERFKKSFERFKKTSEGKKRKRDLESGSKGKGKGREADDAQQSSNVNPLDETSSIQTLITSSEKRESPNHSQHHQSLSFIKASGELIFERELLTTLDDREDDDQPASEMRLTLDRLQLSHQENPKVTERKLDHPTRMEGHKDHISSPSTSSSSFQIIGSDDICSVDEWEELEL